MRDHFVLLASYNEWMNAKLYAAAAELSHEELAAPRGAFFGSILGTLNHIVVADRIWLRRFASHPAKHGALERLSEFRQPTALNEILYTDFAELAAHRKLLDEVIRQWAESLGAADLDQVLRYTTMKGAVCMKRFANVVLHFFNHQTHHRGQLTTLLHQAGKDVGVTDLLVLVRDVDAA